MAKKIEGYSDIPQLDTLPKYLRYYREKHGNETAMRVKDMGIWKKFTWNEYYERVKYFCLGLISLGLKPGDKVSLLGESKPELFWAAIGVLCARGVELGIFADCTPPEVKYYVEHSDSRFVIAHDQEQVDKTLQIKGELPLLKKVIYWDPKGLWSYDDPVLMSFDQVLGLGREYEKGHARLFEQLIDDGRADDIALMIYTSGTTGSPRAAMLTQHAIQSEGMAYAFASDLNKSDNWLCFMALAWGGQALDLAAPLMSGLIVNFPEEPETVQDNIREVGARGLLFGTRQWESLNRMIQSKMEQANPLKRFVYKLCLPVGYKVAGMQARMKRPNLIWRALHKTAYLIAFRPLRDKLGLLKLKIGYSSGTAISPDIIRYFHAIGINIRQCYGSSEVGVLTSQYGNVVNSETCGLPLGGCELRITKEGEVLSRCPWMLADYYKDHSSLEKKLRDGWYCTGDFGHFDDNGELIVMDRMADLRKLKGGRQYSPQFAEIRLRFSPYIKDVFIIGEEDNEYVTSLVNIDLENVGHWAEKRNLSYTTFADLSQKAEVVSLIRAEIQTVNPVIPEYARIKRFVNLPKELDPDEAEMTRTRKLKRDVIKNRYGALIAGLYGDQKEIEVETPVTYRDGRQSVVKNAVKITPVD